MALALLLAAALLLVSPAAAEPLSLSPQQTVKRLSAACLQGAGSSDAFHEIRSSQEVLEDMLTELQNQVTPAPEECPAGWSRHEDSCYLIPPVNTTWYRAHYHCAALDRRAQLASIQPSSIEHIESLVAAVDSPWGPIIGLVRLEAGNGWGWTDGSPMVFTDWNSGEPSGDGDCGHIFAKKGNKHRDSHSWNDVPCTMLLNVLCQITLK